MGHALYHRILLKLSGEALLGGGQSGIDPSLLDRLAGEVCELKDLGVEVALVIGGGNIFRGAALARAGLDRVTADHMGMLATVMNALAMQDALSRIGVSANVMSALEIRGVCGPFDRRAAVRALESGHVLLFAGGTGNPFFTTDTAASLRAIEIGADVLIKATKVDGVYSADPERHPEATLYPRLTFERALGEQLAVMDATAMVLCRDHRLPVRVMNINAAGSLKRLIEGEEIGSLVESGE